MSLTLLSSGLGAPFTINLFEALCAKFWKSRKPCLWSLTTAKRYQTANGFISIHLQIGHHICAIPE